MGRSIQQRREITVREMGVDDISAVYRLGLRLFRTQEASTYYRTWDAYEVTNNFNHNPHLCLVAETAKRRIVGFVLGTTYENESSGWKYGYILWIGVSANWQRSGAGSQLYHAIDRDHFDDKPGTAAAYTAVNALHFLLATDEVRPA